MMAHCAQRRFQTDMVLVRSMSQPSARITLICSRQPPRLPSLPCHYCECSVSEGEPHVIGQLFVGQQHRVVLGSIVAHGRIRPAVLDAIERPLLVRAARQILNNIDKILG